MDLKERIQEPEKFIKEINVSNHRNQSCLSYKRVKSSQSGIRRDSGRDERSELALNLTRLVES